MLCRIIMENGVSFVGKSFGCVREVVGEVVFNTSMVGYQEILTDPSYSGQIVIFTFPLIGNYGVNTFDCESSFAHPVAVLIHESCKFPSNFRCESDLDEYLQNNGIVGISEIDTRCMTKMIRDEGVMLGYITTDFNKTLDDVRPFFLKFGEEITKKSVLDRDAFPDEYCDVRAVIDRCHGEIDDSVKMKYSAVVVNFGCKDSIVRELVSRSVSVKCVPPNFNCEEVLSEAPDFVFLSNGPGDPRNEEEGISLVKKLIGKIPIFGICMGHQIMGLAMGGDVSKLSFGHHGANHPVRDTRTGRVYVTSQNHNYHVSSVSDAKIMFESLNDGTVEGMYNDEKKFMSVQFHPEASPGPLDTIFVFDEFILYLS